MYRYCHCCYVVVVIVATDGHTIFWNYGRKTCVVHFTFFFIIFSLTSISFNRCKRSSYVALAECISFCTELLFNVCGVWKSFTYRTGRAKKIVNRKASEKSHNDFCVSLWKKCTLTHAKIANTENNIFVVVIIINESVRRKSETEAQKTNSQRIVVIYSVLSLSAFVFVKIVTVIYLFFCMYVFTYTESRLVLVLNLFICLFFHFSLASYRRFLLYVCVFKCGICDLCCCFFVLLFFRLKIINWTQNECTNSENNI